jgi:hypothetical protein
MYVRREGLFQALTTRKHWRQFKIYNLRVSHCIRRIELTIHQYPLLHSMNNFNFQFRKDLSQKKTQNYQGVEEFYIQITGQQTQRITFCMGKKKYVGEHGAQCNKKSLILAYLLCLCNK